MKIVIRIFCWQFP